MRVGLVDLQEVINLIDNRIFKSLLMILRVSGTVVLAIVGPGVEVSKVAKTGLGGDRAGNMVEFARLALEYLVEQMEAQGQGNL